MPPFHFHVHVGSGGDILITDLFASKKVEMEVVAAAISVFFCSIFFEKTFFLTLMDYLCDSKKVEMKLETAAISVVVFCKK